MMYFCIKFQEKQPDMDTKKTLTVKHWADGDKPREKMIQQGKKQLTNVELVAILLRSGLQGKSVLELSREVLDLAGNNLTTLSRMEYSDLRQIKGMAEAKATTLLAALELGWRMQGEIDAERKITITDSRDLFNYIKPSIINLNHEEFWVVFFNQHQKVLGRQRISMGGQTQTDVDLRILFHSAIENHATKIAVIHNHPSGSLKPSREDRALTQRIGEAGKILTINLIEHLIVGINFDGKADFYSFHDNGLI